MIDNYANWPLKLLMIKEFFNFPWLNAYIVLIGYLWPNNICGSKTGCDEFVLMMLFVYDWSYIISELSSLEYLICVCF
jgi:hypothetical protein